MLVLNRCIANTAIGRDVRNALKELDVPLFKCGIGQRVVFAECAVSGLTVVEQRSGKAALEIQELVNELRKIA